MVGASRAATGSWRSTRSSTRSRLAAAVPAKHVALNDAALAPGSTRRRAMSRRRGSEGCACVTRSVLTRGTVVIDVEACKGCDLCIDACPPRVLVMTTHDVNSRGYRYPLLLAGLHRLQGVLADLPRLRVPGLQVRHADRDRPRDATG